MTETALTQTGPAGYIAGQRNDASNVAEYLRNIDLRIETLTRRISSDKDELEAAKREQAEYSALLSVITEAIQKMQGRV